MRSLHTYQNPLQDGGARIRARRSRGEKGKVAHPPIRPRNGRGANAAWSFHNYNQVYTEQDGCVDQRLQQPSMERRAEYPLDMLGKNDQTETWGKMAIG